MERIFKLLLPLVLLACAASSQVVNRQIAYVTVAPSGSCSATGIDLLTPNGTLYTCQSGTWGAVSGGGGGGSPAGSLTETQARLNSTTFAAVPGTGNYPSGISNPISAPAVTVNTTGMTTRTYRIVETNGVGWTAPSPATTVTNSGDMGTYDDSVTVPTVADPNVICYVIETVAKTWLLNSCDGSQVDFANTSGPVPFSVVPSSNSTTGYLLPGGFGVGSNYGINAAAFANPWNGVSFAAGLAGYSFFDALGHAVGQLNAQSPIIPGIQTNGVPFGTYRSGFWEDVSTANNAASPYTITESNGIVKCDTAGGNVTINLPVGPTLVPASDSAGGYGRQFIIKKPTAANSCTITTTDGTTINGAASYVLTATNSSVQLYWDGDGDGNTGMWASQSSDVGSIGSATNAACWIDTHTLGHCTSVVGAGGTCTCVK